MLTSSAADRNTAAASEAEIACRAPGAAVPAEKIFATEATGPIAFARESGNVRESASAATGPQSSTLRYSKSLPPKGRAPTAFQRGMLRLFIVARRSG